MEGPGVFAWCRGAVVSVAGEVGVDGVPDVVLSSNMYTIGHVERHAWAKVKRGLDDDPTSVDEDYGSSSSRG